MNSKAIRFLEEHKAETPSSFVENAIWRKENEEWLQLSRHIALKIVDYMQENGLSRADLAKKLDVSPQYVSKILSGKVNFSFKTISELNLKLNIQCMEGFLV